MLSRWRKHPVHSTPTISEIYHVRENINTNDRKCNGTTREPRGVSFLTGTVYFPVYAQSEAVPHTAQSTLPIVLFAPRNLFLERPTVMSALSYATHGCRCRVALKYFPEFPSESGTQMNLHSGIVAPSASHKKTNCILHTIIRIPTIGQCVQSVLIHHDSTVIIIARRGNWESQRALWKIGRHVRGIVLSDSPFYLRSFLPFTF